MGKGGSTAAGVLSGVLRKEGVRGLYKGLGASVLGVSHGAGQLLLYEHIKERVAGSHDPVRRRLGRVPKISTTLYS